MLIKLLFFSRSLKIIAPAIMTTSSPAPTVSMDNRNGSLKAILSSIGIITAFAITGIKAAIQIFGL